MEERLNDLLELFYNDGEPFRYVTGREIIEKMGLASKEYLQAYDCKNHTENRYHHDNTPEISEFFEYFCYFNSEHRILETNPGNKLQSSIWIDNHYGLIPEWQREIKLRTLLDS
jgi:hypothetical protein